jgi:hypothetical protein
LAGVNRMFAKCKNRTSSYLTITLLPKLSYAMFSRACGTKSSQPAF